MKWIFGALIVLSAVACRSKDHVVEDVDTHLESKGQSNDGEIGLNEKGQAILQSKTSASAELTIQEHVNEKLQSDLDSERHQLLLCRRDLSDPRLGGTGEMSAIPEVDNLKMPEATDERLGRDEKGKLVVVRKSFFDEKLQSERDYGKALQDVLRVVKRNREECEQKMGVARTKHGLPAQRYVAKGQYINGQWMETRRAENSLDDAFEIRSEEQKNSQ